MRPSLTEGERDITRAANADPDPPAPGWEPTEAEVAAFEAALAEMFGGE